MPALVPTASAPEMAAQAESCTTPEICPVRPYDRTQQAASNRRHAILNDTGILY